MQPALTVKAIIPSYGSGYGGHHQGGYESAPLAAAYTGGSGYSRPGYGGAPAVDREAIALAKLALAAPSAGGPLVWKEGPRRVQPSYEPRSYGHRQEYARGEEAQGASAAAASSSVAGQKGYKKSVY